jgi:beta-glucosidase
MEDVFLDATEGDDFLGVQVYTRERVGPDGLAGNEAGVTVLPMGYDYWPQALEACLRRAWSRYERQAASPGNASVTIDLINRSDVRSVLPAADGRRARVHVLEPARQLQWAFRSGARFGMVDVDRAASPARRSRRRGGWRRW